MSSHENFENFRNNSPDYNDNFESFDPEKAREEQERKKETTMMHSKRILEVFSGGDFNKPNNADARVNEDVVFYKPTGKWYLAVK